ncbi:MAG: magnesium transporter CorA [Lachnospiraceae bacterium]|nr:magnesium transporter CorA [Lachnospiraceae bacterium]MBR5179481.1 magnesium transporter CorA [Lachnospiraceae bacterium]
MYYLIKDKLEESTYEECLKRKDTYVAIVDKEEFKKNSELFNMGIDMEFDPSNAPVSCVKVNYDSLTGSFSIPDRACIAEANHEFSFALDEQGIVFINDDGTAQKIVERIKNTRKWRAPSLERFIYDFLEEIIGNDINVLEEYDKKLDSMEDRILDKGDDDDIMEELVEIRSDIMDLRTHYEQLIDLGQELEENENGFFSSKNLRYFRMFTERVVRLRDIVASLREHTMQVRDLHHSQLEVKQNKVMTILTVVSTIFMPLTLIVGWYGMNFKYMPELDVPIAYPIVIAVCVIIVVVSIIFFKKKKFF